MRDNQRWIKILPVLRCVMPMVIFLLMAGRPFADAIDASQWNGPSVPVGEILVRVDDTKSNGFDWQGAATVLIQLKPGDLLTPQRLDESRKALSSFAAVTVNVDPQPGGAAVTFEIQPYKRIKSIDISGAYPLFEKDVRTVMTVASGDIFRSTDMPVQEKLIAERYQHEGYIDPRVHIAWEQEEEDGHYHLDVMIEKGAYYSPGQVRLHGNRAYGHADIIGRLKTWRSSTLGLGLGRFVTRDLDEDIGKLTTFYRKKGFADVSITGELERDADRRRISCDLKIEEGLRYTVHFEGNRFYSDFRLKRDLVLFEKGNRGNIGLRRSIQNIRRRYLAAGFVQVQVRWQVSTVPGELFDVKAVVITIEEGRRHIVKQVSIVGNAHLDHQTIAKQMLTRPPQGLHSGAFVKEVLYEDLLAIKSLYRSRGYLGVRITEEIQIEAVQPKGVQPRGEQPKGEQIDKLSADVQVVIHITEGPQTIVGKVQIEGAAPVAVAELMEKIKLKPGDIYPPLQVRTDEENLSAAISSVGYPYVSVKGTETLTEDRTRADVRFSIDAGTSVRTGEIFFFGNFRTRERFLRREMGIDSGAPFDLRKVLEAQRRLRDLKVFDSVQVRTVGLKEKADTVHLFVRCSEKKPYYFEIGGGYQTDKGIFGRAKAGDHNFLGTGKDVSLSGEASEVGGRYGLNIFEPRLLGTRFSANAGLYWERSQPFNQDFGVDTTGASLSFSHDWGPFWKTVLANQFERREQFLRNDTLAAEYQNPEDYEPRAVFVVTPSIQWDNRDSFIRPQRGLLSSLAVDLSTGLDNALDDFIKYRFDVRGFRSLIRRMVFAGRIYAGFIEPYGGDQPPQDQLFFLGGANTVRGYEENLLRYDSEGKAVGGRMSLSASLEARIDIGRNFELIPFVDTGSVQKALVEEGNDDFRWSCGLGLQYITPIGPMGIFYGQKIDRRPGESRGRWHLSIGYTF